MHVKFNQRIGKETAGKLLLQYLMSETPKKNGKKSGRKARQIEALYFCRICRINVTCKLSFGVF